MLLLLLQAMAAAQMLYSNINRECFAAKAKQADEISLLLNQLVRISEEGDAKKTFWDMNRQMMKI